MTPIRDAEPNDTTHTKPDADLTTPDVVPRGAVAATEEQMQAHVERRCNGVATMNGCPFCFHEAARTARRQRAVNELFAQHNVRPDPARVQATKLKIERNRAKAKAAKKARKAQRRAR